MERGLVWPNTAWLLGRSSPSDYILSRLAGVFFLLMFYLFTLVNTSRSYCVFRLPTWSLLRSSSLPGSPRTLTRVSHWGNQLYQTDDQSWLPIGTWLPMPTTGCTSWFWISSGQLGSWRPTRFSPHIWQESGKKYISGVWREHVQDQVDDGHGAVDLHLDHPCACPLPLCQLYSQVVHNSLHTR